MRKNLIIPLLITLVIAAADLSGAATSAWLQTDANTYNWNESGSWNNGFPNGTDDVANLNIDLAGVQTINLNQVITVGAINLGDSAGTFYPVTIAGNGGSIIMDVSSGTASIGRTGANGVRDYISADIQLNDNLVVSDANGSDSDGGNFSLTLSGNISGAGKSITKTGGAVTLSGVNTYSGGTTVNNGYFRFNPSSIGSGPLIINGYDADITSGNQSLTNNEVIINGDFKSHYGFKTGLGPVRIARAGIKMQASVDIQGNVTAMDGSSSLNALDINLAGIGGWGANPTISCDIIMRENQVCTQDSGWGTGAWPNYITGIISDGGNGYSFTKSGSARTVLTATNTFSGDTIISQGALEVGNNLALQNSAFVAGSIPLSFSSGINTPTLGGLKGSTSISLPSNITSLTLNPLAGRTNVYSSVMSGGASGMTLIKTGLGTQVFDGDCLYTGATSVNAGTLLVNGSIISSVTVATNATFGGRGTIEGNVIFAAGAQAVFTVGSRMNINGSLILSNNIMRLNLPANLQVGTYRLVNFNASGSSGAFFDKPVVDSGSKNGFASIAMGDGYIDLIISSLATVITIR